MNRPPTHPPGALDHGYFGELLRDQLAAARDAALANDLIGEADVADWWPWRAEELTGYLEDAGDDRFALGAA